MDAGNVVTATDLGGGITPMLTIQRMDPIYAEFSVPESELTRVRERMAAGTLKVECRIPDKLDAPRDGVVFFIDNSVQNGTGTIRLRARIKNAERFFWPGQFVKVRLIFEIRKNTPLVPAGVPQISQTGSFVFVVTPESTVEMRSVKLGQTYDDMVAIDDGLKAGEQVVLSGPLMLFDKAKVTVASEAKAVKSDVVPAGAAQVEVVKKGDSKNEDPK